MQARQDGELVVEASAVANRLVYMIFLCSCVFAIFGRSIGKTGSDSPGKQGRALLMESAGCWRGGCGCGRQGGRGGSVEESSTTGLYRGGVISARAESREIFEEPPLLSPGRLKGEPAAKEKGEGAERPGQVSNVPGLFSQNC